jgi:hypothetical protein
MDSPRTCNHAGIHRDLGLNQGGQQYGAEANEMRLCRGVGGVAQISGG